jgi:hypothetical protein
VAVIGSTRIVIEGLEAVIRLGYQRAAALGAWRVEGDYFSARVLEVDGFRITQPGLILEIPNRDGVPTKRPIGEVSVVQGQLSGRLLPKR